MRIRKSIVGLTAVAALALPAAAMAAAPDGSINFTPNWDSTKTNPVALGSSEITQNGQFISGKSGSTVIPDQTTEPGSRAAIVQGLLGH
jgi:hypothetical protein